MEWGSIWEGALFGGAISRKWTKTSRWKLEALSEEIRYTSDGAQPDSEQPDIRTYSLDLLAASTAATAHHSDEQICAFSKKNQAELLIEIAKWQLS